MRMNTVALALATAIAAAPVAACPDYQRDPYFGQINLYAGFLPDPDVRNVTAGGTTDLTRCLNGTAGYVTTRPDFRLNWDGLSAQLTIAVSSSADAVLLVNAADGLWYFSDDYRGTDPALTFLNPQVGQYDIWIGSYDGSRRNPARLVFTEGNW